MKYQTCPICNGSGQIHNPCFGTNTGSLYIDCPKCLGSMVIPEPQETSVSESVQIKLLRKVIYFLVVMCIALIILVFASCSPKTTAPKESHVTPKLKPVR